MFLSFKAGKWLMWTVLAALIPLLDQTGRAQVFTNLYSFAGDSEGGFPGAPLIQVGNRLYGTTGESSPDNAGSVFAVNMDGSGFTTLHTFTYDDGGGTTPAGGLIVSGQTLYGTTRFGGTNDGGTLFAINTDGSGFTNLYNFTRGTNGANPASRLAISGQTLYGTLFNDSDDAHVGTVYAINTNGTGFAVLHTLTDAEGGYSQAGLVVSGQTLYGTTSGEGIGGTGAVFALNTDGSGFTILHSFADGPAPINCIEDLVLSGQTLYSVTVNGGSAGLGTLFAVNTNGMNYTVLHTFSGNGADGLLPHTSLICSGSMLYGVAANDQISYTYGMIFAIGTNGMNFTDLYDFTGSWDGGDSTASLLRSGQMLYGTTLQGGGNGAGTVFAFTLPPDVFASPVYDSVQTQVTTWQIKASDLLTNVSCFSDQPYSLASVEPSTNGVTLTLAGDRLQYTNINLVNDQFACVVTNAVGNHLTNTVTLLLPLGGRVDGLTLTPAGAAINFIGVPDSSYAVQVSTNLTDWTTLTVTNVPDNGSFQYLDAQPIQPAVYYRLQWQGN